MILADVNVLIYAFRPDIPEHAAARHWLNRVIGDRVSFGVSPLALSALVRVTTGSRFFPGPSTLEDAFGFCDDLLGQPRCRIIEPGERHWTIFRRLCIETNTAGRRVTDAWYAALAIEAGCTWITFDRDFARFPGLRWSGVT